MNSSNISVIVRMARKELREILRDRRTIFTLVLMPVLLYPILSIAFRQYFLTTVAPATATEYRVAIATEAELTLLTNLLDLQDGDPKLFRVETEDVEASVRNRQADLAVRL
ncbi:MAG: hypothetical protein ACJ8F7_19760, partial [Gemmataceae bacterium]